MRLLIFMPPREFRDESVAMVKLFFDKWGIKYSITSYTASECVGLHGAVYKPDVHTSKVLPDEYDGIVLIDGSGVDAYKLYDYRPLLDLILKLNNSRKYIISIDNALKVPARANVIKNVKVAVADQESKRLAVLFHGIASDKPYEISGNIMTIRGSRDVEDSMQAILDHMGAT